MRKHILMIVVCSCSTISTFAQWSTNGNNVTIDKNIGIGTTAPSVKLDVNGDIKANALHLKITEWNEGWGYSRIYYPGHSLVIGSPEGVYSYNALDLKPGGAAAGEIPTAITMWVAHNIGNYEKKVQIRTAGDTYFNGGNVGIGTDSPSAKLDVNGDAKVNLLHLRVTNPGASWGVSKISYGGHSLRLGSAQGSYAHNAIELMPEGAPQGLLHTNLAMYVTPKIGEYLKKVQIHTAGDTYFNGGNVGIGTDSPSTKLDVNGDAKVNTLHLRTTNPGAAWGVSKISYPGHSLIIGSPENTNISDNALDIKPGGSSQGKISSLITLYVAHSVGNYEKKVQIRTIGNSFFNGGNVGIGTNDPKKLLDVKGTIHAQNVEVDLNGWSDFVFDKDYKLPTLQEVESHINEYKRLPDIPSEKQVKEEGINIGEMQAKLLQKIEELTLYVIKQDKEIQKLKQALSEE